MKKIKIFNLEKNKYKLKNKNNKKKKIKMYLKGQRKIP